VKQVLDPCCGSKMFWFDKTNQYVLFSDIRKETHILCDGRKLDVCPDEIADFIKLPHENEKFNLIVFDPPHMKTLGASSWMAKKYGCLNKTNWESYLSRGFNECWRVLKHGGTLIFKWNTSEIKLKEVLKCFCEKPLFGQTTTINLKTHWIVFYKPIKQEE
jgi:SAM-dependent methyltransferase